MKTMLTMYAAFIAGVLAAAGVAYWYFVQHMEGNE